MRKGEKEGGGRGGSPFVEVCTREEEERETPRRALACTKASIIRL